MTEEQLNEFAEYQRIAHSTAQYPEEMGVYYTALGLAGEAGELCNKVKKIMRDRGGVVDEKTRADLASELGDIGWYWAECCTALGLSLAAVVRGNVHKLADRAARNAIKGSGDNR